MVVKGVFIVLLCLMASEAVAQPAEGEISGVLLDVAGMPLANQRVELERPSEQGPGRLLAMTGGNGEFRYTSLRPGRYTVALVIDNRIVARSGPVDLSSANMRADGVVIRQPSRWVETSRKVEKLPRRTAAELLGGQGVATSFAALQTILRPGHQVVFRTRDVSSFATFFEAGGLHSGQDALVAEISANRFVLVRKQRFGSQQEIVLTEDSVARIDAVDSTKNGLLIGVLVGAGLAVTLTVQAHKDYPGPPYRYIFGVTLPLLGGALGASIDGAITEPVFERPAQRVTFAPLIGPRRLGAQARVVF